MPLTMFRCPDKETIPIPDCLNKCRMATRCLTKPTLMVIVGGQREWSGTPSTTQLLNGTMMEYLKITKDYAVDPKSRAFSLMGIDHHAKLAKPVGEWEAEKKLVGPISGITDLLIPDEDKPGYHIIVDHKNFGSYRVAKVLGLEKSFRPHPTETYRTSGRWGKAGSPKSITIFTAKESAREYQQEQLQLNQYRVLAENAGYKISKLQLQVTVRDGGTQAAKSRGVMDNIYYPVDIPILPDTNTNGHFSAKYEALMSALETGNVSVCTEEERWQDRRCENYCDVADVCEHGKRVKWLKEQKNGTT
jgi:hypothetical protein